MDLSNVRVFAELSDVDEVNAYIALGWKCVNIAMHSVPHSPVAGICSHIYIMGWTAETPPQKPSTTFDDDLASLL